MKKIQPTSIKNDCPVCGDASGKCRSTDTELVLCMNTLEASSTPDRWKFIGLTKGGGQWGKFVPAGQPESGNTAALRQQRAAERAAIDDARFARMQTAKQRQEDYLYKIANCPILEADQADLIRRGLKDEDIAKLNPINDGRGGYIIPIRDKDGLMVGGQRRLSVATKGGRYRWATTGENQLPETKELPLAHWQGSAKAQSILLVEGTGVKPYLAAKRLDGLAIGAAGGNFASSPKTLKATLDRYSDLPVLLVPDAGAVNNKSVMRQYANVQALLKKWGRELQVVWWSQESKTDGDIDEIGSDTAINEISWDEFWSIAVNLGTVEVQAEQKVGIDATLKGERPHYESSIEDGLLWVSFEKNDSGEYVQSRTKIGNHLEATAYIDNPEQDGAAILLEFGAVRGGLRKWTMPSLHYS